MTTLEGRLATLEGHLATPEGRLATSCFLEAHETTLEGRLATLEACVLETQDDLGRAKHT